MPHRAIATSNSSIALITAAAVGSLIFTLGAGTLVYQSTNRVITAARWVQHSQEVLTSLQSTNQYIDRIEANSRLYASTGDEDTLNAARSGVLRLEAATLHLKGQVPDNAQQTVNLAALEACASGLSTSMDRLTATKTLPNDQIFRCRQTLNIMSETERKLLQDRIEDSQQNSSASLTSDVIFAGLSLAILCVLFAFLLRDAFQRRRIARKTSKMNQELALSVAALEDQALESKLLTDARDELQLCIRPDQIYTCAARSIPQLIAGSSGSLGIIDNSRHLVETVASWGEDPKAPVIPEIFSPSSCCGLRSGSLRWRRTGLSEIHCTHFTRNALPDSYLCIPMVAYGESLGILFVQVPNEEVTQLVEKRLDALRQLIQLISMAIASMQVRLKLENQSIRDPLTGLFNRHFMQITLQKELARSKRKHNTLGVLMLDVDHFKTFNDRFGHTTGDSVLQSVAAVLQSNVRNDDFVCRFGGEEFIIILPEMDDESILERAENIRRLVADIETSDNRLACPGITISIGIALSCGDILDPADIIQKADHALYQAKNQGRNRVILHTPSTQDLFAMAGVESLGKPA